MKFEANPISLLVLTHILARGLNHMNGKDRDTRLKQRHNIEEQQQQQQQQPNDTQQMFWQHIVCVCLCAEHMLHLF